MTPRRVGDTGPIGDPHVLFGVAPCAGSQVRMKVPFASVTDFQRKKKLIIQ